MRTKLLKTSRSANWLHSPRGRALLQAEIQHVRQTLDRIFGDQLLQIGGWGGDIFLPFARTRRAAMLSEESDSLANIVGQPENLCIANDSIDAVLLPHALEHSPDPHRVLREVDRILRPDGHAVILGFNPVSLWGARHLLSGRRFPDGIQQMISEQRLRDWLRLLNFSVQDASLYFYQAPILRHPVRRRRGLRKPGPMFSWGRGSAALLRRVRPLAACYVLVARKEVFSVTPVRPAWKPKPRLVGTLVNPTTRIAA